MLKVIVRNPDELARQRGPLAGLAANLAPELVRQAVDVELARQLRSQMAAQGVRAEVLIEPNPGPAQTRPPLRWLGLAAAAAVLLAAGAALHALLT